ncbi:MAG: hypothetical protein ACR2RV_10170 [Verrucomicrobiales bacterium]
MRREFDYDWARVKPVLIGIPLFAAFILWKEGGEISSAGTVIFVLTSACVLLYRAWPICRVHLDDAEIQLSFPIPFRPGWRSRHEDIEHYAEISLNLRGKKLLVGGMLQRAGGDSHMLTHSGTKGFEELNEALLELYPRHTQAPG